MNMKTRMSLAVDLSKKIGIEDCNDLTGFLANHEQSERLKEVLGPLDVRTNGEFDTDKIVSLGQNILSYIQWFANGLNVFDVTESLLVGLLLTTPSDEPGFPRLPYPAFMIRIPAGYIPIRSPGETKAGNKHVTTIMVNHFDNQQQPSMLRLVSCVGSDSDENVLTDRIYSHHFTSVAAHLKEDEVRWAMNANNEETPWNEVDSLTQRASMRVLSNLCSWLESVGGMQGRVPSNAVLNRRRADPDKMRITQWIVGREVKIDPELFRSAKEHMLALDPRTVVVGWHLRAAHTVRGHIRHQACGKGLTERKTIWIKPFHRGPKGGDVMGHIYKVGESKKKEH